MREPDCTYSVEAWDEPTSYVVWARENKKRADRLLAAAQEVVKDFRGGYKHMASLRELEQSATDYEDTRG